MTKDPNTAKDVSYNDSWCATWQLIWENFLSYALDLRELPKLSSLSRKSFKEVLGLWRIARTWWVHATIGAPMSSWHVIKCGSLNLIMPVFFGT